MIVIEKVSTADDIISVCKLAEEIWRQHYISIIGAEQVKYMLDSFQSFEAINNQISDSYEYYILKYDGMEAGYMSLKKEENQLFLSKLYVKNCFRRKGIASEAFGFIEKYCITQNLKKVYLLVNKHNSGSVSAYKSLGLSIVRAQLTDIGNGFFMDDYIMEKQISK